MSGIGPTELIVLVVVGLLILGPERLPRVATQIGRWVGKARRTANQLRYQLEREITLADIEGKKKKKDQERDKTAPSDDPDDKVDETAEQAADQADSPNSDSSDSDSSDSDSSEEKGGPSDTESKVDRDAKND